MYVRTDIEMGCQRIEDARSTFNALLTTSVTRRFPANGFWISPRFSECLCDKTFKQKLTPCWK